MQPISRRGILVLGGLGAAGVLVGGIGLTAGLLSDFTSEEQSLVEPKSLRSDGGGCELGSLRPRGRCELPANKRPH